jgi:protein SCO1
MKRNLFLLLTGLALLLSAGTMFVPPAWAEVASHGEPGTPEPGTSEPVQPIATSQAALDPNGVQAPVDVVQMREIRYEPKLNAQVPLDYAFKDETGKAVKLGDYLGDKPLLISINDFSCQDLCPLELQNLVDALDQVPLKMGADFNVLAISLNPANGPAEATELRDEVVRRYKRPDAPNGADGWHFLTTDDSTIHQLANSVGLHYAYDINSKSYAHPVGVVLLTPEGKIARYIYGMDFPPNDLRLAIYEASRGRISDPITPILLLCYHYDIATGRYTNMALTLVRTGGVVTVLGLGTFIGVMVRRERRGGTPGEVATVKPEADSTQPGDAADKGSEE